MHLIQAQSLSSGQIINQILLYEKYFPLPFDKYVMFAPYSKDSKNYDFWQDVINIVLPILEKAGIKIVQMGAANEKPFRGVYYIAGQTNIGQIAYLIKNSLLFFGADSFGQHVAGHYNIPLIDLVSNNYANVVRPYFGDAEKQIILEPPRDKGELPSFSFQENPKAINRINTEDICKAICKLLGLDYTFPYKQIYCGAIYLMPMVISVCDTVINPSQIGVDGMIIDMTINFNEQILANQLQVCPCSIITNKPINLDLLKQFKANNRIREVVYVLDKDHSVDFVESLKSLGIGYKLLSELPQEEINSLKLDYWEYGVIIKKQIFTKDSVSELKDLDINTLYYKSAKFYVSKDKVYPSLAHIKANKNIGGFDDISPVIDSPDWWDSLDSYKVFSKI